MKRNWLSLLGGALLLAACSAGAEHGADAGDGLTGPVCEPGERRCAPDGKTAEICRDDGSDWEFLQACASGQVCEQGECTCGACAVLIDDECRPVGVRECPEGWLETDVCGCEPVLEECPEGTLTRLSGGCDPVGPSCGEGWQAIPGGGCEPVLDQCKAGAFAPIGGGCQAVGPHQDCGAGKWGDIPSTAAGGKVLYVWGGFEGPVSKGTQEKPFKTIKEALKEADKGDTIAVGAEDSGREYVEGLAPWKQVRLLGRCADKVSITGSTATWVDDLGAVVYIQDTEGVEIAGLAVRGPEGGIVVSGGSGHKIHDVACSGNGKDGLVLLSTDDVEIEDCSVSDNGAAGEPYWGVGVSVQFSAGISISGSLIERNVADGVNIHSSQVDFARSVVKDTQPNTSGTMGRGIEMGVESEVSMVSCLVAGNRELGVGVFGSSLSIDKTIVRDTQSGKTGIEGRGLQAQDSEVQVLSSAFLSNREDGISVFSSTLTLENCLVRDTLPNENGKFGRGVHLQAVAEAVIRSTSLVGNAEVGLFAQSQTLVVEETVIRDTKPDAQGAAGWGIELLPGSSARLERSAIIGNTGIGVAAFDSHLELEGCLVADTRGEKDLALGRGINLQAGSVADVVSSVVEGNAEGGINVLGSTLAMSDSIVRDTAGSPAGINGDGIQAREGSTVTVHTCLFEGNTEAGIMIAESSLLFESSLLKGTSANAAGEHGQGLQIQSGSAATLRHSFVTSNTLAGVVVVESDVVLERCSVATQQPTEAGLWGLGVAAFAGSKLIVDESIVAGNHAAGISYVGSAGKVRRTRVAQVGESLSERLTDNGYVEVTMPMADGVSVVQSAGDVLLESNTLEGCERVAVIFDHAEGKLVNNVIADSLVGFVAQDSAMDESGTVYFDNGTDKYHDPDEPFQVGDAPFDTPTEMGPAE